MGAGQKYDCADPTSRTQELQDGLAVIVLLAQENYVAEQSYAQYP